MIQDQSTIQYLFDAVKLFGTGIGIALVLYIISDIKSAIVVVRYIIGEIIYNVLCIYDDIIEVRNEVRYKNTWGSEEDVYDLLD